ncbi:mitofusin [Mycoemilia scoparia]|uniref:Mitofusin n=1 Tax=Mycoemilia scoparia TaxID=417184 RepID=A0A9W8DSC4_9FUNG|nr:mitofusin [Mycoemilia scoparia]
MSTNKRSSAPSPSERQMLQQHIFSEKSQRLQNYLHATKNILHELGHINRDKWNVHFPIPTTLAGPPTLTRSYTAASFSDTPRNASVAVGNDSGNNLAPPHSLQRANSYQPMSTASSTASYPPSSDEGATASTAVNSLNNGYLDSVGMLHRPGAANSGNFGSAPLSPEDDSDNRLRVLRLDLRYAHHEASSDIMSSLESSSIARLFDDKLVQSITHIDRLISRVSDKSSKILVTGDLNAGKSTLVNALLRSNVLPTDQQPCTMLFCEVVDAGKNGGVEEIHAIPRVDRYSLDDPTTYAIVELKDLEDLVMDNEEQFQQLKIYARDTQNKSLANSNTVSLLNNGVTDVSIIDSPGLNRDSLKTTQLFARQEEIDVVVFVVNAENHFTLSGQDFLLSAGKEKAHIFIVVNRFDAIRRKDRCQKMIMDQIMMLSPHTAAEANDLVHFISAQNVTLANPENNQSQQQSEHDADGNKLQRNTAPELSPEFSRMERCLKTFALDQRFKSKLAPAQRYSYHVLQDVEVIANYNMNRAMQQIQEINALLRESTPVYETLLDAKTETGKRAENILDGSCSAVRAHAMTHLNNTLENIAIPAERVEWPGLWSAWSYAENVIRVMAQHLEHEVGECERFAKFKINQSMNDLDKLKSEQQHHINRYEMLEQQKSNSSSRRGTPASQKSASTNGSQQTAVTATAGEVELSTSYLVHIGSISNALDTFSLQPTDFVDFEWEKWSMLTTMSMSAGTLALLATRLHSYADSIVRLVKLSSTIGSATTQKLLISAAAILGVGSALYLVSDMDSTVRNNVARRMREALREEGFSINHADRLSTETTRSLRPFVWKLQHTFQRMVEAEERRRADQLHRRHTAQDAQMHFDEIRSKARELAEMVARLSDGMSLNADEKPTKTVDDGCLDLSYSHEFLNSSSSGGSSNSDSGTASCYYDFAHQPPHHLTAPGSYPTSPTA